MMRLNFLLAAALASAVPGSALAQQAPAGYAVGPQYDTTHIYVAPADFDRFVDSVVATFGGTPNKKGTFQVTPTSSQTMSQAILTPAGSFSVFGFLTPIPYPFGAERTGYLVSDIDAAVASAQRHGATRLVATFPDPIGRDAIVQWPGGVNMQFYWHTQKPSYPAQATVQENRIYLTPEAAPAFLRAWTGYAHARITADDKAAPGVEIGQPGKTYRRVRLTSGYGRMTVFVSDNPLPWPYGRDLTGYEVADLGATLGRAAAAGVETLVAPHPETGRVSAIVRFPGGYIAEIHAPAG
ncbi:VOC family protein [Sphingomonas sp. MMS12-HWE2-04]|uniref:VOC family protein n=1 Tax=Sphingomonas sp. MMS12-HWE2-04 TaxID=3234199 RepID=UPI00384AB8D5